MSEVAEHAEDHGVPVARGFWSWLSRWLFTTNHKDIGTLYLVAGFTMYFVGGAAAMLIRLELFEPGLKFMQPDFYNQLVTMHGLIMIFGFMMPVWVGFANWQIPMMIGAPDMALPRLNNWSFWILPFAFVLLLSTMFMDGGGPNFGWTLYAPLSTKFAPPSTDFLIFSIHLLGISSIMGSINIIATILNMRAPGMTLMKMPIFCWGWLITAFLLLAVMPVLAGGVTMMLTDRHFGTSFFDAAGGGDPILFQHIFWFFGHPEVYILVLPAFGVISEIIPTFSRKKLFGRDFMIYAIIAIAVMSFIVWAHHLFTTGLFVKSELFFMYATMLIAVPTGVKVFNWITTMYRGCLTFETPMLFALAFIFLFTLGGFTGIMLSIVPSDYQYQDSYFVVGHFHYVLVAAVTFAIFAGLYYWLPKWTGTMYDETLGKWHFWLSAISVNVAFFPMHFLGLAGMPRRIPDYALQFADFNAISTVGALVFGFSQFLLIYIVVKSARGKGIPATPEVWEGHHGLEWKVDSPAPYHTYSTPPEIKE